MNPYNINPYFQPMPNYAPQPTLPTVKTVNSFNEITANDVAMSTPFSVFVSPDLKAVQVRRWNGNGQIEVMDYDYKSFNLPSTPTTYNDDLHALTDKTEEILTLLKERLNNEPKRNNTNVTSEQSTNAKQSHS